MDLEPRVKLILKMLLELKEAGASFRRYLDLGCGDGYITSKISEEVGATEVYGADIKTDRLEGASARGVKSFQIDLERGQLPFESESFDLVSIFEVIEHLVNTDQVFKEAHRVLVSGGYLLLTTPNLACYANRLALLLGYQPYSIEASNERKMGLLFNLYKPEDVSGHIRTFTLRALKELLEYHGFELIKIKGCHGVRPAHGVAKLIDKLFALVPSLARKLVIIARKPDSEITVSDERR